MTAVMTGNPLHHVLRGGWIAEGVERENGEILDTSTWIRQRSIDTLVKSRYLDVISRDLTPVACKCNRLWESVEIAQLHECPITSTPASPEVKEPTASVVKKPSKPRVSKVKV